MASMSDFVVVATPVKRLELEGAAVLPGVKRGGSAVPAVAIETTFHTVATLKGGDAKNQGDFIVLHYREAEPSPSRAEVAGPTLIDFKPSDRNQYLMFLKRRKDGRYEAVNPTEPGWCIEKLSHQLKGADAAR